MRMRKDVRRSAVRERFAVPVEPLVSFDASHDIQNGKIIEKPEAASKDPCRGSAPVTVSNGR